MDFQKVREEMQLLHDEIVQKTTELLDDAQDATFVRTVQEMRAPRPADWGARQGGSR
ncbi:MAG: hypothetical protein O3A25_20505 [Acidobacteria bacterium]|nr:hypothetical protein [Acidobacteriota bacterium]